MQKIKINYELFFCSPLLHFQLETLYFCVFHAKCDTIEQTENQKEFNSIFINKMLDSLINVCKYENYHQWWSLAIIHAIEKMSSPYKGFKKKLHRLTRIFTSVVYETKL